MAVPPDWKRFRAENGLSALVAVPAVYSVTLAPGAKALFTFNNLTRSVHIVTNNTIYFGLTVTGVEGSNKFPIATGDHFIEVFQTSTFYLHNASGVDTAIVNAIVVLTDANVNSTSFGELSQANGFDGGDASDGVTIIAPPA